MSATYSRLNPSPRYHELVELSRHLHELGHDGDGANPEDAFDGRALFPEVQRIQRLCSEHRIGSLLDYGCGKAKFHKKLRLNSNGQVTITTTREFWQVDEVALFDPAHSPYAKLPDGRFDAVICIDVLEHCPEEDIAWILDEIFSFATRLVFVTIACYPAKKLLPNGENAHCTIKPLAWWKDKLTEVSGHHPGVHYVAVVDKTGDYVKRFTYIEKLGEEVLEG